VGRLGRLVALAAGVGEADVDPAAVLGAEAAGREPVALEPGDDPGQGALAEVQRLADVVHAAPVVAVAGEPVEHLELAHAEAVRLERALDRAVGARVVAQQLSPRADQRVVCRRFQAHDRGTLADARIFCIRIL
jgi:hypothetical protein